MRRALYSFFTVLILTLWAFILVKACSFDRSQGEFYLKEKF